MLCGSALTGLLTIAGTRLFAQALLESVSARAAQHSRLSCACASCMSLHQAGLL